MCNGLPVAGYEVQPAIDVIKQGVTGYIDEGFGHAINNCQQLDHQQVKQSTRK